MSLTGMVTKNVFLDGKDIIIKQYTDNNRCEDLRIAVSHDIYL
jgi:hypothetical protein